MFNDNDTWIEMRTNLLGDGKNMNQLILQYCSGYFIYFLITYNVDMFFRTSTE